MDVRPLREADIPSLHDDCWVPFAREMADLDAHDALADDLDAVREANIAHRRERFADDDAHTVVAVPDDVAGEPSTGVAFAGYAAGEISESPPVFARGDALYVADLYVRPEFRREGLADRLLDAVETWGADRGCERAELHVNARNETARSVYERRGYDVFQHKLRRSL